MKKLFIAILLIIISLPAEPYRINGVREFHRTVKSFVAQSGLENIKKLNSTDVLNITVELSSIVLMVDELTDNNYLQNVLSAIEAYEDYLSKLEEDDDTAKGSALGYLDDLKKDMINQNKSDMAGGTRAYKFDIEKLRDDDLPLYEIKKEIEKGGPKTLDRYLNSFTKIDADIINRMNDLKIDEISWKYIHNPTKDEFEALLLFKGRRIKFPNLRYVEPEALKVLSRYKGALELDKLEVNDAVLNILLDFQTADLKITGLTSDQSSRLAEKMSGRYQKKIMFKKRKRL